MYLKSLTLKGFKSFASATTLKFEPGICAVVGPNGSGKSNVVDALAWVMGEQGVKTLRGGKMEDVIFAGAGDRKPLGRAEVTLTIDNSDGALDIDYTEVSVTRRMFRDGASEYEINGAKARLMDIQELLSDSGIGREMHVIVGQGRLAQILESRPEERRAFIEEAAGVLKHKRRKEKAQRKLVGMQANLDRLTDLTRELSNQLKPLARQAEAAKRAATVQAELRDLRLKLAGYQLKKLKDTYASQKKHEEILTEQVEELRTQLEEHTSTQLQLEEELGHIAPEADQAQHNWFQLSSLAEQIAATTRIATERTINVQPQPYTGADPVQLESKAQAAEAEHAHACEAVDIATGMVETIQQEVEEQEQRAREADREHMAQIRAIADRREGVVRLLAQEESQQTQLRSLDEEIDRIEHLVEREHERVSQAEVLLRTGVDKQHSLSLEHQPLDDACKRSAEEAQAAETRLEELRSTQRDLEKHSSRLQSRIDTLRATLPENGTELPASLSLTLAPLASILTCTAGMETALSAALGEHAHALAAECPLTADQLAHLGADTRAELNRSTIISRDHLQQQTWRLDTHLPDGATWLLDHLSIADNYRSALNQLLADVVLLHSDTTPDADSAAHIFNRALSIIETDPRLRIVTHDGTMIGHGWITLGRARAQSSLEIHAAVSHAETELLAVESQLNEISGTLQGARSAAEEARIHAASSTAQLRELARELSAVEKEISRAQAQVEANKKEQEKALDQLIRAQQRRAECEEALAETRDRLARVDNHQHAEEPSTESRDHAHAALAQVKAMEMEAKLKLRSAEDRAHQLAGKAEALRRQAAYERQAKARHEQAQEHKRKQVQLAATVAELSRDLHARALTATTRATEQRDQLMAKRTELQHALNRMREKVNATRTHFSRINDQAHAQQLAQSQAQVRLEEAEKKLSEQLGIAASDIVRDYSPDAHFNVTEHKQRLAQAERDLNSLGKVNPLALEEFKALEERYEFLSTQLADVEKARADLSDVIADVDAKILQLFTDAWKDVEKEFPKVFSTLFPGGDGRLLLTDPDDMLSTGIEVEARPPGKKVKRLSLLSGGEKSLTALAMLVAIFRARPSPFYVMDEVEAALDDVNLRRLIALFEELRTDSQLIVITHQKPTMDVANVLYGVTMRGDGVTKVISQRMSPQL
ncbi:MAG: chromosome segregation protein SMC [Corynebacterium sp.]|uniref:chromosome segregation protein SMC n=1 Tax=Corynebacterium sp. TaxID=1720 RepID=UPI0026DB514F|nr:chromosome segregation protein SMC [Corynebacterium sp.]MDO4762085.1 chromosome segregation protein SMC [Corynebacterium sp.]